MDQVEQGDEKLPPPIPPPLSTRPPGLDVAPSSGTPPTTESTAAESTPSSDHPAESPDASTASSAPRTRRQWLPRNVKITLMVLLLFFVGEYILLPELASARREFPQLRHLNFLWLILGALLEIAALAAYAELTHTVLSPGAPSRFRIFRINMWALAISHVLPGGTVPGTAASYRLLTESGEVSGSTAAFGLATQGVGSAAVLNIIFWLALLISIPLQGYNPAYGFAAILGVLFLAIFGGVVFLLTRGEKQAAVFIHKVANRLPFVRAETVTALVQKVADRMKILLSTSDLLLRAGIWAAANWILDAASLWVFLLAFGANVSPIDVLVAYGLANILAVIPVTPSGLGVVELTIVAVLTRFHVPGGVAAAGVLSWRLVNFWLPIPFGGASYLSLRLGRPRAHAGAKAVTP
jgi:uncharacterized protein (TIRG00374 family)